MLCTDKEDTPGVFRALAASFRKYKMLFWTISASDAQARKAFQIDKVLIHDNAFTMSRMLFGLFLLVCTRQESLPD